MRVFAQVTRYGGVRGDCVCVCQWWALLWTLPMFQFYCQGGRSPASSTQEANVTHSLTANEAMHIHHIYIYICIHAHTHIFFLSEVINI